jgi:hypothetical protein
MQPGSKTNICSDLLAVRSDYVSVNKPDAGAEISPGVVCAGQQEQNTCHHVDDEGPEKDQPEEIQPADQRLRGFWDFILY